MTAMSDPPAAEICRCEFHPYDPADYGPGEAIEESWHYRRACTGCGEVWWSLHCPHDGVQRRCPGCGFRPPGSRTPLEFLSGSIPGAGSALPGTPADTMNGK